MSDHLRSTFDECENLQKLLRESKAKKEEADHGDELVKKVESIIESVLYSIKDIPSNAGIAKESLRKLMKRIEGILSDFVKIDPKKESDYSVLIKSVSEFLGVKQQVSASVTHSKRVAESSEPLSDPDDLDSLDDDFDVKKTLEMLSRNENIRLCYFLMFPAGAELKKREIIHFWLGVGLTDSLNEERHLMKLVRIGFIDRIIVNKKLVTKYKMPKTLNYILREVAFLCIPYIYSGELLWKNLQYPEKDSRYSSLLLVGREDEVGVVSYLNISQSTLNAAEFKKMSQIWEQVRALHLGCWQRNSRKYIVVEDVEAFKYLKNKKTHIEFLSLEGVSGIETLPEVVYELKMLKVLDLRACSNLEKIPLGIKSLQELTHLDLSGCHLLDDVPLEISNLTNLQVLKGYIINPEKKIKKSKRKGLKKLLSRTGAKTQSPVPFHALSSLKKLRKLMILTRRMDFPTHLDFKTFCQMEELSSLRIVWVESSTEKDQSNGDDYYSEDANDKDKEVHQTFPATLTKLELQAANEHIASRLLRLISDDVNNCGLEKLHIRGGGLREINHTFPQPRVVRLRYLPDLQIHWNEFDKLFPNLRRLEILECPNLLSFPCDYNGVWERSYQSELGV